MKRKSLKFYKLYILFLFFPLLPPPGVWVKTLVQLLNWNLNDLYALNSIKTLKNSDASWCATVGTQLLQVLLKRFVLYFISFIYYCIKRCKNCDKVHLLLLVTVAEDNQKAPLSIATTQRCRGGRYSFPCIASLYP